MLVLCAVALALTAGSLAKLRQRSGQLRPDTRTQAQESSHTAPGMVYVPGGLCLLGTDDADADDDVKPLRREVVPSFYIDRTEVTNSEFRKFQSNFEFPPGEANLPAANVTYAEAAAYAKWAGKRLPTESEWEKAARGVDGRRYPWGNGWDPHLVAQRAHGAGITQQAAKPGQCAIGASRVQPVGSVAGGASPYGCVDMAGNAWEWVQGFYNGDSTRRILRGGAVGYGERSMRTYNRAIEATGAT